MDLAVKFARNYDMVLVGFARGNRYNIYSGEENFFWISNTSESIENSGN